MCVYTEGLWTPTCLWQSEYILRVCEHLPASGRASIYWGLWTLTCIWQSKYILRVCEHLPASGRASIYWGFVNIYQTLAEQVYTEGLWTPTCLWQSEYILRFVNTYLHLAEWVYTEVCEHLPASGRVSIYWGFVANFCRLFRLPPAFLSHSHLPFTHK